MIDPSLLDAQPGLEIDDEFTSVDLRDALNGLLELTCETFQDEVGPDWRGAWADEKEAAAKGLAGDLRDSIKEAVQDLDFKVPGNIEFAVTWGIVGSGILLKSNLIAPDFENDTVHCQYYFILDMEEKDPLQELDEEVATLH